MENILAEAKKLAANGVKELILVAQDTTLYGTDLYGESRLPELLEALCQIDGLHWIRLLYCYPEHITEELLQVMAHEPKIAKYIDIPLQHANGDILRAMRRTGDRESLEKLLTHIRETVPGIVLRTTVMVGFPGEDEAAFTELCQFIKKMQFERLGCFAFSPEEGTVAAKMENQVPDKVKNQRRDSIMELQSRISDRYNAAQVGKTLEVLVESYDRYAECWFGRSEADAPDIDGKVFFAPPMTADGKRRAIAPGDIVRVRITDCMDWDLMGECVDESAE